MRRATSVTVLITMCAVTGSLAAQSSYSLVEIDPLGELIAENFVHLENGDLVLGWAAVANQPGIAFGVYGASGAFQLIPLPAGNGVGPIRDWNTKANLGVGNTVAYSGAGIEAHAFVVQGGIATRLNDLKTSGPDMNLIHASGVNSSGWIVGHGVISGSGRAMLFDHGAVVDLSTWAGPSETSGAYAINDAGQIAGYIKPLPQGGYHACVWHAGNFIDLHDPSIILGGLSTAADIDRYGNACGEAVFTNSPPQYTAALWTQGTVQNLGTLPGGSDSTAVSMNDLGSVVGWSDYGGAPSASYQKAVLWKDGQMIDLNVFAPAGRTIMRALAINDDGSILVLTHAANFPGAQNQVDLLVPNCTGGSTSFGTGCPGTNGITPKFFTRNCPTAGNTFALVVEDARPNAPALLLIGTGNGSTPLLPNCALQILPLLQIQISFLLDSSGELFLPVNVPSAIGGISMQVLCADPGANGGISSSRPLLLNLN